MQTRTGDDLIQLLLTRSADDDVVGPAANDLLDEFWAGYPVTNLTRLLHSGDDKLVRTGAWLLSELGELGGSLIGEVPALLSHPLRQVRFFAIEAVLLNGQTWHGPLIAQVMNLSTDGDSAVRWKVLGFLAEASTDQLRAGAVSLGPGRVKEPAEWLVRHDDEQPDPRDVVARLEGPDQVARLFAAAAAARWAEEDPNLLMHAATAEDEEIRSFAQEWLEDEES
ncbi:hypothetical protein [Nonomuraea gerenzanensis]|uniref:FOG: HEAT repeat n=1 Tax=Nonomuraea gerenzanensis TaxID=93944 RepID=A0A1M4DW40_9ACTN|nr:hypothetical protein [Nonomuraea gerenzanensis]UBU13139.1 hypothetical protein LCN96_54375 [Nonomuraea gerenzanensis]SBO90785.1 hypothetical protein BN4615_P299 [Nonomuraea gerenzanensis]